MKFILGKKLEMSQIWIEDRVVPVTLVEAGPCFVTEVKEGKVQIGFEKLKERKIKKSQKNTPYRYVREFKGEAKVGDEINADIFEIGDRIKVSANSKGKGFQGVVKRYNFAGFGGGHGVKHGARKGGSIGSAKPTRVVKGQKMPGRMGNERVTVKNLEIAKIDGNLIAIKGAVPGRRGTLVEIYEG